MNRRGRSSLVWLLILVVLSGCGSEDVPPSTDLEARAAIAAFTRYWDEAVGIANAGRVPENAFVTTATGRFRQDEIARATQEAHAGVTRSGAPRFKDHRVTVEGDRAVVVACINEDDWPITLPDRGPDRSDDGWRTVGRELTKIDGEWLVSDYSPASGRDSC